MNIGGIAECVPDDLVVIRVLKPAVVGVMPTKMRIDDVSQDPDVALAGYVPTANAKPGHINPAGCVFAKVTEVPSLLMAGWHRAYRGFPGFS